MGTDSKISLSNGNTYPAIALPWGMNFWMPQTGKMGDGWAYTYASDKIRGFKQTHQPSPWINDYGQFSIMPMTGPVSYTHLVRKSLCMTDNKKTGVYTSRQGFTYRLAFTYLDYAEANNEAYDTSAARELCLKYLNKVRERAGVRQYTFDAVSDLDENFIHIENTQAAVRKVCLLYTS